MRQEYKDELAALKSRMEQAELFAEKLPIFKDKILEKKLCENDSSIDFGNCYKKLYLRWGIKRFFFSEKLKIVPTNYNGTFKDQFLFKIYVNSLSLYDSHENYDLNKIPDHVDVFFYDNLNTTFYLTDSQIENFLNALNAWYLSARDKEQQAKNKKKIEKLKKELSQLTDEDKS